MKNINSILPAGCKREEEPLPSHGPIQPSVLAGEANVKERLDMEALKVPMVSTRNYVRSGQRLDPVLAHHLRLGPQNR